MECLLLLFRHLLFLLYAGNVGAGFLHLVGDGGGGSSEFVLRSRLGLVEACGERKVTIAQAAPSPVDVELAIAAVAIAHEGSDGAQRSAAAERILIWDIEKWKSINFEWIKCVKA